MVAKVNGTLWDLDRPLEGDSSVELLNFDDVDGKFILHAILEILTASMQERKCFGTLVHTYWEKQWSVIMVDVFVMGHPLTVATIMICS